MSAVAQPGQDLPDHAVEALEDLVADAMIDGTPREQLTRLLVLFERAPTRYHRVLFACVAEVAVGAMVEPEHPSPLGGRVH